MADRRTGVGQPQRNVRVSSCLMIHEASLNSSQVSRAVRTRPSTQAPNSAGESLGEADAARRRPHPVAHPTPPGGDCGRGRPAVDFESDYEQRAATPVGDEASLLVLGFDGTGVHTRPEALREQTRKLREAMPDEDPWPSSVALQVRGPLRGVDCSVGGRRNRQRPLSAARRRWTPGHRGPGRKRQRVLVPAPSDRRSRAVRSTPQLEPWRSADWAVNVRAVENSVTSSPTGERSNHALESDSAARRRSTVPEGRSLRTSVAPAKRVSSR